MEEDQVVKALCYLYWSAYHAGHHDTVEGQYTDVVPADRFDYHREAVMECIQESDMASLGIVIEQARGEGK